MNMINAHGIPVQASWYFEDNPNTYAWTLNSNVQYWAWDATLGWSQPEIEGGILHELLHNLGLTDMLSKARST
jgi:hypothetical protein